MRHKWNAKHNAKFLPELLPGQRVWVKSPSDLGSEGIVDSKAQDPQSYWVRVNNSLLRRNRKHLFLLEHSHSNSSQDDEHIVPLSLEDTGKSETGKQTNASSTNSEQPATISYDLTANVEPSNTPSSDANHSIEPASEVCDTNPSCELPTNTESASGVSESARLDSEETEVFFQTPRVRFNLGTEKSPQEANDESERVRKSKRGRVLKNKQDSDYLYDSDLAFLD